MSKETLDNLRNRLTHLEKPNSTQTWKELEHQLALDMHLFGSFYIWLIPNGLGIVCEVYRLPSINVARLDTDPNYPDRCFVFRNYDYSIIRINPDQIIEITNEMYNQGSIQTTT